MQKDMETFLIVRVFSVKFPHGSDILIQWPSFNIPPLIPWVVKLALYLFQGLPSIDFFIVESTDYFSHCDLFIQLRLLRYYNLTSFIFLLFLEGFNWFNAVFADKKLPFAHVDKFTHDLSLDYHFLEDEAILAILVSSKTVRLLLEDFFFFQVLNFKHSLAFFVNFQVFIFDVRALVAKLGVLHFWGEVFKLFIVKIIAVSTVFRIYLLFEGLISDNAVGPARPLVASHYYNLIISQ